MVAGTGPILVFDSGLGGLSVYAAVRKALPGTSCVYVADNAAFPYGDWSEPELKSHIVELLDSLIDRFDPSCVVIACNTASTLVLGELRDRFDCPFVGTVPAIKPAAERSRSGVIAVLATPGTIARDYTRELIDEFAQSCHVRLVGAPDLARLSEAYLAGVAIDPDDLSKQIAPCFYDIKGARADIVVLGCTHFPFLTSVMAENAPWQVHWLDPAPAIARRVASVRNGGVGSIACETNADDNHPAYFTDPDGLSKAVSLVLERFRLTLSDDCGAVKLQVT